MNKGEGKEDGRLDLERFKATREWKRGLPKPFKWTEDKAKACVALATGKSNAGAARIVGCHVSTIEAWRSIPEFSAEVDRVTLMTGLALPAHRVRLAKQFIDQQIAEDGTIRSKRDILDWLRFIDDTMEGVKATLLAALHRDVLDNAGAGDQELVLGQAGGTGGEVESEIQLNQEKRNPEDGDRLD